MTIVSADQPHEIPPTTEPTWQDWLDAAGPWPIVRMSLQRLVVLAAHPDDEVLGAGGLMASAAAAGVDVVAICMSDGSGSHVGSRTLSPEQLSSRRHVELDTATSMLGLRRPRWCGLPHGSLSAHPTAMADIVEAILDEAPGLSTGLLSVWCDDGPGDHEAVGRCAQQIARRHGMPLWMYPIHMWHWARPGEVSVPWERMQIHRLDPAVLLVKRAAVRSFVTQIRPLSAAPEDRAALDADVLAHLLRPTEFVFA